ncbi:hypothetical protein C3L33_23018, partial [Rhododendron williamsianum]
MIQQQQQHSHHKVLPKRIILVRHGESQGNRDNSAYSTTPDYKIPLTPNGVAQAKLAGAQIRRVVSDDGRYRNWKVYFYVSPYERTRSTLSEIGRSFPKDRIIGVREECRVREQDFGNFQEEQRMKVIKETREKFGRFFYRFPEGESAADVYDRVSSPVAELAEANIHIPANTFKPSDGITDHAEAWHTCFLETLWRDIDMNRFHLDPSDDLNLIIVSHGLASRVFLTKWFKWTVEQFEYLNNLGNCEFRVVQLGQGGDYSLAIHHTEEEMQEWGLSPDMIADQKWRACGNKGNWYENCQWYLDEFFDKLEDTEDSIEQDQDENEV